MAVDGIDQGLHQAWDGWNGGFVQTGFPAWQLQRVDRHFWCQLGEPGRENGSTAASKREAEQAEAGLIIGWREPGV